MALDLKQLLKTSPRYISLLAQTWIQSVKDFLLCFPRAYEDRWTLKTFETLEFESKVAQSCKVLVTNKTVQPRWNKKLYSIEITDSNGDIAEATYFNNYFQYKKIEPDARYIIVWKPKFAFGKIQFAHPEFIVSDENTTWITSHNVWRIFPVYAETMWIKSSWFAKNTRKALTIIPQVFHEYLPDDFLETYNLMWVHETIRAMHYPQSYQEQEQAMYRIFFSVRAIAPDTSWYQSKISLGDPMFRTYYVIDGPAKYFEAAGEGIFQGRVWVRNESATNLLYTATEILVEY